MITRLQEVAYIGKRVTTQSRISFGQPKILNKSVLSGLGKTPLEMLVMYMTKWSKLSYLFVPRKFFVIKAIIGE